MRLPIMFLLIVAIAASCGKKDDTHCYECYLEYISYDDKRTLYHSFDTTLECNLTEDAIRFHVESNNKKYVMVDSLGPTGDTARRLCVCIKKD